MNGPFQKLIDPTPLDGPVTTTERLRYNKRELKFNANLVAFLHSASDELKSITGTGRIKVLHCGTCGRVFGVSNKVAAIVYSNFPNIGGRGLRVSRDRQFVY